MSASPLPLSAKDIDGYFATRNCEIDKDLIDAAIFALDDAYREQWAAEQNKTEEEDSDDE